MIKTKGHLGDHIVQTYHFMRKKLRPRNRKLLAQENEKSESVSYSVESTLCDPMDCSPPGSSAHGILQARILEWVAFPFSRGFSQPRHQTQVSCIAGRFFTL